jgi:hypothetical protein
MSIPLVIAMFAGFLFFSIRFLHVRNKYQIAIFFIVPIVGILANFLSARWMIAKLQALPARGTIGAAVSGDAANGTAGEKQGMSGGQFFDAEANAQYQGLLRTSPPRQVRMAKRGQFGIALAGITVLIFATGFGVHLYGVWARTLSFSTFGKEDWVVFVLTALILLLPYGIWRGQVKETELLEKGEITLAKVTRQWTDEHGSQINYEFKDFQGGDHRQMAHDYTTKLYAGMSVPVFYDRDNPKRQVAYCATLHEVVL